MTATRPLGPLVHSFFLDHLITVKGLRPASVRSYRDTIRLLLCFTAPNRRERRSRSSASSDLTFERVLGFLRYLEDDRRNHVRTRNQRLAALHTLFDYIAGREPRDARRLPAGGGHPDEAGGTRRDALPRTRRGAGAAARPAPHRSPRPARPTPCCCSSTTPGRGCRRSPTYESDISNSGRPPSSVSTAKATNGGPARYGARPHSCSPSCSTRSNEPPTTQAPVFCSAPGQALTRFGIYKIVRRHAGHLDDPRTNRTVSPHIFRHTALFTCSRPASKSTSSAAGSVTPTCPPPTATPRSTPERRSRHSETPSRPALRRDPALTPSGGPTSHCSTGCHRSDRYVAVAGSAQPFTSINTPSERCQPHNGAGHRTWTTGRRWSTGSCCAPAHRWGSD